MEFSMYSKIDASVNATSKVLRELTLSGPGEEMAAKMPELRAYVQDVRVDMQNALETEIRMKKKVSIDLVNMVNNVVSILADSVGVFAEGMAYYRGQCEAIGKEDSLEVFDCTECTTDAVMENAFLKELLMSECDKGVQGGGEYVAKESNESMSTSERDSVIEGVRGTGKSSYSGAVMFRKALSQVDDGSKIVTAARRKNERKGLVARHRPDPRLKRAGLSKAEPKVLHPRLKVFDVPIEMRRSKFLSCLVEENLNEGNGELWLREVRVVRTYPGVTKSLCNYILECTGRLRERLIVTGRIFIEKRACRVTDWIEPIRCCKCVAYGHLARGCKSREVCRKCGSEEHSQKACNVKMLKCVNCMRSGRLADHYVMSPDCPTLKAARLALIRSTQYN